MRHYQVRDVMTANPTTVTPATPLKNVADILVGGRIGVVPVLTPHGRVAGAVAEGDLLRKEQLQRDPDGGHSVHLPYRIRRDIATAETAGELMDRYPAYFRPAAIQNLLVNRSTIWALLRGDPITRIWSWADADRASFLQRRASYLIYK